MAAKKRKRRKRRSPSPTTGAPRAADSDGESPGAAAAPAPRPRRRRSEPEPPPEAPWGSFPLVELAVLAGIVLLVGAFAFASGTAQGVLLAVGLVLCSLAGLEVAVREHVAGYRSHTFVLAAVPAVATLGGLFYLAPDSLPPLARLAIGAAVFGLTAWGLTALFRGRSGGRAFRVRAPRRR